MWAKAIHKQLAISSACTLVLGTKKECLKLFKMGGYERIKYHNICLYVFMICANVNTVLLIPSAEPFVKFYKNVNSISNQIFKIFRSSLNAVLSSVIKKKMWKAAGFRNLFGLHCQYQFIVDLEDHYSKLYFSIRKLIIQDYFIV